MTTIRPLHDRVIIARAPLVEQVGRIILPEVARVAPVVGCVVAVGRGRRTAKGTRVPLAVAPGDIVMFSAVAASTITVDETDFVMVRERDLIAVYADDVPGVPVIHPAADVSEDDHRFEVAIDLPGVHQSSIHVSLTGTTLTVEATRRPELLGPGAYLMRERMAGRLVANLELPRPVVADEVRATYQAGVLTLSLPKAQSARTRHISVLRAGGRAD